MSTKLVDEEWDLLASLLPDDWRGLASAHGAIRRQGREIPNADVLLQVILLHVATGLSLKQAAARARVQGLATITDVALLKRLRTSGPWLTELARRMFEASRFAPLVDDRLRGRRLRAVDASTIEEPGATGTDWRVHYTLQLPELTCDFFEVTDVHGSETYKRVPIERGDVLLADRGYSHREGVAHVLRHGGDVVVRLTSAGFPLLDAAGAPFDQLAHLRLLAGHQPGQWTVQFEADGATWPARVCAIRKSQQAAELSKRKILHVASKKQRKVRPETLEFAEYVMVLTTLPADVLDAAGVLSLYRARWQIELCFKRMKPLLRLGHLPKRSDASARAWIQGKLLTVLLIERLITEARAFSPWGFRLLPAQQMA